MLRTLVCLLNCFWMVASPNSAHADSPPNIVVILADDLGCCDMALYNGWVKTPRIERMAEQGMLFTDFHTNSSVCSPTRAAFLTGRYQQRVGIVDVIVGSREPQSGISSSTPTLPRVFKDNGYATVLFGKWHCGYQDQYNPVHHGFDEFVGFLNGATDYHKLDLFPTLTDIAGLSKGNPENLDGASFKAHLLEQKDFPDRDIFFGYEPKLGTAMRRGDWKMIVKEENVQLFNLQLDPQEITDVADQHPGVTRSMKQAIDRFKSNVTFGS